MERQGFENSWKEAFKDSEILPSDQVWTNIELDLEREKAAILRKRLIRYQWLAAASVIFSIGIGVSFFLTTRQPLPSNALAQVNQTQPGNSEAQGKQSTELNNASGHSDDKGQATNSSNAPGWLPAPKTQLKTSTNIAENRPSVDIEQKSTARENKSENQSSAQAFKATENTIAQAPLSTDLPDDGVSNFSIRSKQAQLVTLAQPSLTVKESTVSDPVAMMLAKLDQRERELAGSDAEETKHEKKQAGEKLWTSVGFAAGSFKSVKAGTSPSLADASTRNAYASSIATKETKAAGMSYTMGFNLGARLTDRVVLQGGVNYLNQTSEYTQESLIQAQNFTSFRPASINELNQLAVGDEVMQKNAIASAPYNVNNNVRYLSVPLQAGYMLLNKGFGIQMNAGLATDMFLQNTVTATSDGEKVDPVKAGIGQNSAFRPFLFSGLMGTELSYKVGNRYRIALNPGLRYPFNNIYKSNDYKASRMTFDVGLRFRYIFH